MDLPCPDRGTRGPARSSATERDEHRGVSNGVHDDHRCRRAVWCHYRSERPGPCENHSGRGRPKDSPVGSAWARARRPREAGGWRVLGYRNDVDKHEHIALVLGDVGPDSSVLVRMHSKCLTGDVFHSLRCDCGWQLETAMKMIAKEGKGVIVYLDQEGRGIGLINKLKAYELQDQGVDTVEANERLGFAPDLRNYGIGAQILLDLGLKTIRPITNNPRKLVGLEGYGLKIDERVPIISIAHDENSSYLEAKRAKLGHLFAS